jgi:hypothetical protein
LNGCKPPLVRLAVLIYSGGMKQDALPPSELISVDRVRELVTADDPAYAASLTEQEWREITLRLDALTRLLWEFSQRRAAEDDQARREATSEG